MKTRIEINKLEKDTMYLAQAQFGDKFMYINENPIGHFELHNEPQTQFNWIEGAEKLIDKYLIHINGNKEVPEKHYVEYPRNENKYPR